MISGKITIILGLICILSGVNSTGVLHPYVYKFGTDYGSVVQELEGTILPLQYVTIKDIDIPEGMELTYVEVQVYALSSPKVDYDNNSEQVSIAFSITQLSMSRYKIIVKAVPSTSGVISGDVIDIIPGNH